MNNEYESGRYGTYLKYFLRNIDFEMYKLNVATVKEKPNVSWIQSENIVNYDWESKSNDAYVLTELSNLTLWRFLTVSGIVDENTEGLTKQDLGNITMSQIRNTESPTSGNLWDGDITLEDWELFPSIFYTYDKFIVSSFWDENTHPWSFDEFQYFTHPSINRLPENFFDSCTSLTSIVLPPQITEIGERAFHDCWNLTNVVILHAKSEMTIYDEPYGDLDDSDYYNMSAFYYTGFHQYNDLKEEEENTKYASSLERVEELGIIKYLS